MSTEMLQEFDLPQSALCQDLFAEDIGDLLYGYAFARLIVGGSTGDSNGQYGRPLQTHDRSVAAVGLKQSQSLTVRVFSADRVPDNSICPLTQLFGNIVTLVDDEVLVEDLEDLATLKVCHFALGALNFKPEEVEMRDF